MKLKPFAPLFSFGFFALLVFSLAGYLPYFSQLFYEVAPFHFVLMGFFLQGFLFLIFSECEFFFPLGRNPISSLLEGLFFKKVGVREFYAVAFWKSFPPGTILFFVAFFNQTHQNQESFFLALGFFFGQHLLVSFSDVFNRYQAAPGWFRLKAYSVLTFCHLFYLLTFFRISFQLEVDWNLKLFSGLGG